MVMGLRVPPKVPRQVEDAAGREIAAEGGAMARSSWTEGPALSFVPCGQHLLVFRRWIKGPSKNSLNLKP